MIKSESAIENSSLSQATIGLTGKDMWRANSSLMILRDELAQIKNPNQKDFQQNSLHDWFNTRLYKSIFETKVFHFNPDSDPKFFSGGSEVTLALTQLNKQLEQSDGNSSIDPLSISVKNS